MASYKSLSIVIPVYKEQENLQLLMQELDAVSRRETELVWEFLFVDDGSTDGSLEILRALAAADPRVKVTAFTRNFGQTAAMSCGIMTATGDVIIPLDADLQNDPADIPRFLEKIDEGFACISGWRRDRKDELVSRKIPSWCANALISWMTGVRLHDYGCSLKAYRRDVIQGVSLYGEMHRFIPVYAASMGAKVTEIPVNHRPRRHGESKYGLSRVFKVMLDLIVVKFLIRYFNRPMHFFGMAGFLALGFGFLCEIAALYYKLAGLKSLVATPLPVVGAMFIIVGVQFILTGLIAEVLMRTYYETQKKTPYAVRERWNP